MPDTTNRHAGSVRASVEAFNRGDAAGYSSHYAEDARLIGPFFPEPLVGRDVIEETTASMSAAFPDMRWTIVSLLEDGSRVACELHIEGTHSGPLSTPDGDIPATGRQVSFDVAEILEFTDDDLVAEHREYMDPGAMMAQLGLNG
jgi:predicted ester cyclase